MRCSMRKMFYCLLPLFLICAAGCTDYDLEHPDAKANRKVFKIATDLAADSSVKDVFAYADEFPGLDPLYCVKFTTTPETVAKIIEKKKMKKTDPSAGDDVWHFLPDSIEWWNLEDRKDSDCYVAEVKRKGVIEIEYVLWHNPQTGKCHFLMVCF